MVDPLKSFHEEVTRFFESPDRVSLRDLLKRNFGELDVLDFKKDYQSYSNTARHILAMANSGGGCIVFGVEQLKDNSLDTVGLEALRDEAEIRSGMKKYLPKQLNYCVLNYNYKESEYKKLIGKNFQVIIIENQIKHLPFVSENDGDKIKEATIYVRRGTSSVAANYTELQEIINARLSTGYSSQKEMDLEKHIEQLRTPYKQVNRYITLKKRSVFDTLTTDMSDLFGLAYGTTEKKVNPKYPEEDIEDYVLKCIEVKKKQIIRIMGIENE